MLQRSRVAFHNVKKCIQEALAVTGTAFFKSQICFGCLGRFYHFDQNNAERLLILQ